MPLLAGREFTLADELDAPKVAIVNEQFAKKFDLGRDAVGKWMATGSTADLDTRIVGLAPDAKYSEVKGEIPALFFRPYRQDDDVGAMTFYVPSSVEPDQLLSAIPRVVGQLDPNLPVEELRTMAAQVQENVFLDRVITILSAAFAVLGHVARGRRALRRARVYGVATHQGNRLAHGPRCGCRPDPRPRDATGWRDDRRRRRRRGRARRRSGSRGAVVALRAPGTRPGGSRRWPTASATWSTSRPRSTSTAAGSSSTRQSRQSLRLPTEIPDEPKIRARRAGGRRGGAGLRLRSRGCQGTGDTIRRTPRCSSPPGPDPGSNRLAGSSRRWAPRPRITTRLRPYA